MLLAPPDEDVDAASAHRVRWEDAGCLEAAPNPNPNPSPNQVRWEDVGGLEATKQLLTEAAVRCRGDVGEM